MVVCCTAAVAPPVATIPFDPDDWVVMVVFSTVTLDPSPATSTAELNP